MGLTASESGNGDFAITPEGVYTARCYRIIDLGTQKGAEQFGGKEQHKVMISWELIGDKDDKMEDGRPFSIHKRYTVSLHEKAQLRHDLEAWRGKAFTAEELKGFDLTNVLGAYCTIQVVHDETGKYANVNAIMAYKGDKPKPVNENVVFDIDNPDMDIFNSLSDSIKGQIMQTPEWQENNKLPTSTPTENPEEKDIVIEDVKQPINLDDIPF